MKVISLILGILFISSLGFAELTTEEENYYKVEYSKKVALDTYRAKIAERDALLTQEDNKCAKAKNDIMLQYEIQIKELEPK